MIRLPWKRIIGKDWRRSRGLGTPEQQTDESWRIGEEATLVVHRFNFICRLLAAGWIFAGIGGSLILRPSVQDFDLYYTAGKAARLGEFDALYSLPDPNGTELTWGYERLKPRTRELARVPHGTYLQPPWNALLLAPLSLLPFQLAHALWLLLLLLSVFICAECSGRIYATCVGGPTRGHGLLVLLVALSPLTYRVVRVNNPSAILAGCVALAVVELVRRDSWRGATAIWLGGMIKFASGVLLPVAVVMRRWHTVAWTIGLGLATVLSTLAITGLQPFQEYGELAAEIGRSTRYIANQSFYGMVLRARGGGPVPDSARMLITLGQIATLLLILILMARRWKDGWRRGPLAFAASTALLASLLSFSPLFWEHYHILFTPLWGWMVWEAGQSRARKIIACLALILAYVPLPAFPSFQVSEPFGSYMLFSALLMLLLGVWRLWIGDPSAPPEDRLMTDGNDQHADNLRPFAENRG